MMADTTKARHFLRRFISRALVHGDAPQNLHVNPDGWAGISQVLGIARSLAASEGVDATDLTPELVQTIVMHSAGVLESDAKSAHQEPDTKDSKTGEIVPGALIPARAATVIRAMVDRSEPKADDEKEEAFQFDRGARAEAAQKLAMQQKKLEARTAQANARTKAAHEQRLQREKEAKARADAAARSDVKNARRIADPKDPSKLAQIAPPTKRLNG